MHREIKTTQNYREHWRQQNITEKTKDNNTLQGEQQDNKTLQGEIKTTTHYRELKTTKYYRENWRWQNITETTKDSKTLQREVKTTKHGKKTDRTSNTNPLLSYDKLLVA